MLYGPSVPSQCVTVTVPAHPIWLQSSVPKSIRVNEPLKTRAASGIDHFDALTGEARAIATERRLVSNDDVGAIAAGLGSDYARTVTGNIAYADAGNYVMS